MSLNSPWSHHFLQWWIWLRWYRPWLSFGWGAAVAASNPAVRLFFLSKFLRISPGEPLFFQNIFLLSRRSNSSNVMKMVNWCLQCKPGSFFFYFFFKFTVQPLTKVKSLPNFFSLFQWVDCSNFSWTERLFTKILLSFYRTKKFSPQRLKEL